MKRESEADARRSPRFALVLPARCRTLNGFVDDVVIRDLSAQGCRIKSFALSVRPGAHVVIRPQNLEGLCGTVRWVSGHEAGIEFDRPLYGPVVEHLHRSYASFLPPERPLCGTGPRRLAA